MKIIIKSNGKFIKKPGLNGTVIEEAMKKLLKKKHHLCSSCCSVACGDNRNIKNIIVKSGIKTPKREYIFECSEYQEKRKLNPLSKEDIYTGSSSEKSYRIVHPTVRSTFNRK